ncbi:MAG: hypothetical protein HQL08_09035 [Nitrospirae bacterium]|nr:hypothetical protein [Nitrospirota bacterium]
MTYPGAWDSAPVSLKVNDFMTSMMRMPDIASGSEGVASTGMGLMVYFGTANLIWALFDALLIVGGLSLIADGLFWHVPAEKIRKQYPYCFGEMEITIPDYGTSARFWKKVVFSCDERE